MATIQQVFEDPASRKTILREAASRIRAQVSGKRGWKGSALRRGLATVESLQANCLEASIERLVPVCAATLQAHYDRGMERGDVVVYFAKHDQTIAEDLLKVTDARAHETKRPLVGAAYRTLRPQAKEHVLAGMPFLAELLHKHLG